ncbi:methyltransferase family protein [Kitasatospora phosalacinea]|uniref:methyltransferase family protein n=1 Tax=Kitasatospora phosalacinea TaxID=2065 RepID=UPI00364C2E5A
MSGSSAFARGSGGGSRIARLLATRAAPALALSLGVRRLRRPDVVLPLLGLAAWTVAEALSEDQPANHQARSSTQDRGTRQLVLGAHLACWWLPSAALLVRRSQQPVSAKRLGVSLGLLSAGAALRVAAVRALGDSFTAHVQVGADHALCRSGPYGAVRHPSYSGLMLLNTAPAVAVGGPAALLAAALTAVANSRRVAVEERALTERLGQVYTDYADEVPRWIPAAVRPAPSGRRPPRRGEG